MPKLYDDPKDQPKVEEAFKPSGEDNSVQQYQASKPNVVKRIFSFDQESIAFAPDAVGHVVTQLPGKDENAGFIGNLMSEVVPWIRETTRFADVPGQLLAARINAQQIADPDARRYALEILNAVQKLPIEQQFDLLTYLSVTHKRAEGRAGLLEDAASARQLAGIVDEVTGVPATVPGTETNIYFDEGNPTVGQGYVVDALREIFPGIQIGERGPGWAKEVEESFFSDFLLPVGEWGSKYHAIDSMAQHLEETYQRAKRGEVTPASLAGDTLRLVGDFAAASGEIGFDIAGDVTRRVPVVGDVTADFAGRQARAAEEAIGKAIEPVLTYGMDPIGKDPHTGQPVFSLEDQRTIEARSGGFIILTGLGGMAAGSLLGKAGRRVKTTARAAGKDVARATLEASRSVRRGGVLGTAAESYRLPIRKITEVIDKGLIAFKRDPEKFFSTGIRRSQGQRLLDTLAAARKAHPGTGQDALDGQVGFVRQVYGDQMNERLTREMLKQTTREGEMRVFVDTLVNPEAGTKIIKRLQANRAKVAARLRELQDPATVNARPERLADAARRLEEKRAQDVPGATLPETWHADLRSALDEYNRIKGEDHEISRLRAQELALDWQVKTTFDDTPMLQYPRQSIIRAAVRNAPVSRVSKILHLFTHNARILDPQKTVDELPRFPELHVHGTSNAPPNALQQNSNVLSNYMQRAGVPARVIEENLGKLSRVKTRTEFYDLLEKQVFGEGGAIDKALNPKLDPEIRRRIINLHDSPIESRTFSVVSETFDTPYGRTVKVDRPVLPLERLPGEYTPLPSRPTEFLETLSLPDVELLIEADSFVSRNMRNLGKKGPLGTGSHQLIWRLPRFVLRMFTLIGKPAVMLPRVLLGAMPIRIQLEQLVRSTGFGYKPFKGIPDDVTLFPGGIPVPLTRGVRVGKSLFGENGWKLLDPDPRMEGFSSPNESDIGMFMSEMFDDVPVERVPESTLDFRTGKRTPKRAHWDAFRKELEQAHADFVDRKLASLDLDEAAFLKWLDKDPQAKRYMDLEQKPELERAGVTVKEWAHSRIAYLKQLTKENPKYLDTIVTGKSRSLSRVGQDFGSDGRSILAKHGELTDRLDVINSTIKEKLAERAPGAEIAALQNERRIALRAVERLRRENEGLLDGVKTFKLADKGRWIDHVKEEWAQGRMELPDRLLVEKRVKASHYDGGVLDTMERFTMGISNAMYKPFKILSYADLHGTRGSLFTQAYRRQKHIYRARGLDPATADAMAYARAGEITKDLMYDLNARTSLQRSLKDTMWFAPAWQEVLYTWAVKIPSEAYWPVGATSLVLKGAGFIDVLSAAGVIKTNSDGEKVIMIPGLGPLIEKLTGTKVPDVIFGKVSGLNLVTTGGGVPGLSTPANWALGKGAMKFGGVFKDLSDVLQPYGPEASILPTPVVYWWEALTGSAPSFEWMSPERQKADWDRSLDIGIQYAWNEMTQEGRDIPRPEDFGAKKDDEGNWLPLSVKQQAAYEKANRLYIRDLFDLAKRYQRGIAFVRAIGSSSSPMTLYATSSEKEEWDNFWNKIIIPEGFGDQGMTDRQRDLVDDYLEDHPNSLAFSVFYRGQGQKIRDLPFPEDLDDEFYDSYLTGESITLSPQDYSLKLMATESRRYYQSQLSAALKEISPDEDPWVLLTHGSEKKDALDDYYASNERWKFLNPKAAALLEEQSALWRENNNVPTESFEAERLSESIRLLRQIAPMLTGEEGIRPDYLRRTMTDLNILYSQQGDFGPANTPQEKALEWYFSKVFEPRIEETTGLYAEAQRLDSQGLPSSHIYNQIRDIYNRPYPKYKGEVVPSVEAVFFGNRNEDERNAAINSWRSRPVAWLSDFQLEQSGYNVTPETRGFLDSISKYDEEMWAYIRDNDISFSSKEYDQLKQTRLNVLGAEANRLGPDVARVWALNEAAPYVRLNDKGFGSVSPMWGDVSSAVGTITQRIIAQDLSPKGFSQYAAEQKIFLYTALSQARDGDGALDDLFVELSYSFPLPGGGYREGASLYEAVFFGNFNTNYIPFDVASAAQVAA